MRLVSMSVVDAVVRDICTQALSVERRLALLSRIRGDRQCKNEGLEGFRKSTHKGALNFVRGWW